MKSPQRSIGLYDRRRMEENIIIIMSQVKRRGYTRLRRRIG
jgi:hypothetical protein